MALTKKEQDAIIKNKMIKAASKTRTAVRHQLPVIDRRLMRPDDGHVLERMSVVHEQCVSTAEPYPADAIFHDAVYTSVIGSFRHLMKAVVLRVDSV